MNYDTLSREELIELLQAAQQEQTTKNVTQLLDQLQWVSPKAKEFVRGDVEELLGEGWPEANILAHLRQEYPDWVRGDEKLQQQQQQQDTQEYQEFLLTAPLSDLTQEEVLKAMSLGRGKMGY